tara:strand:+ start:16039 stop:16278 length:240 start_codon:yes stop_codon:yes gene_type:complete
VALLALIPGCEQVVQVSGRAEITSDETMKQAFAVQGNAPKLVTRVMPQSTALHHSPAPACGRRARHLKTLKPRQFSRRI